MISEGAAGGGTLLERASKRSVGRLASSRGSQLCWSSTEIASTEVSKPGAGREFETMRDPLDRVAGRLENLDREEQSHPGDEGARGRRMRTLAPVDERLAMNPERERHLLDLMTLARKTHAIRHDAVKRLRQVRRHPAQHVGPRAGLNPATELRAERRGPVVDVAEHQFMHTGSGE